MSKRLDVGALLRQLHDARVEYILIGGLAVNAWGVIRSTKDVDICPSPDSENLARLAGLLRQLDARQLGVGIEGFAEPEMPFDPTKAEDLADGRNFRLETTFGVFDIMRWVPGIDADHAFATLAASAERAVAFGIEIKVCSLADLRVMKRATGRPQDLADLADLDRAHPPES
ncbi:MAG: hypothetical protein FWD04_11295 [Conexibacteraceae bacterium]|nr:hypothetical protein [Conexibacteraceae bacterium]